MNDSIGVQIVQRTDHLPCDVLDLQLWQAAIRFQDLEQFALESVRQRNQEDSATLPRSEIDHRVMRVTRISRYYQQGYANTF